jgi:hypothetical protein
MLCETSFVGVLRLCKIIGQGEGVKIERNLNLFPFANVWGAAAVHGDPATCSAACPARTRISFYTSHSTALGAVLGLRILPRKGEMATVNDMKREWFGKCTLRLPFREQPHSRYIFTMGFVEN